MQRWFIASCLLVSVVGCNSNPYTGVNSKLGAYPAAAPKPESIKRENFSITSQHHITVLEGTVSHSTISAVAEGQTAVLGLTNPPDWVKFDPATGDLEMDPPVGAAKDPNNPVGFSMDYEIEVSLLTAGEPVIALTQGILVTVIKASGAQ